MSKKIMEDFYKTEREFKVSDMKECLKNLDKNLFLQLIDKRLTLD